MKTSVPTIGCVLSIFLLSCTGWVNRKAADTTYQLAANSSMEAQTLGDLDLARAASAAGIAQLRGMRAQYPFHRGIRQMLMKAHCQFASGFVALDLAEAQLAEDQAKQRYHSGRGLYHLKECGHLALKDLGTRWAGADNDDAVWADAFSSLKEQERESASWLVFSQVSQLGWAPVQGIARLPLYQAALEKIRDSSQKSKESLYTLMQGALDCNLPRIVGGNSERGRASLMNLWKSSQGANLVSRLIYAESCSGSKEKLEVLTDLVGSSVDRWPRRRLENLLVVERARIALALMRKATRRSDSTGKVAPIVSEDSEASTGSQ